jgi:outer membrane protein assembly factor BamB
MNKHVAYIAIVLFLQSCNVIHSSSGYTSEQATPAAPHSLLPAKTEAAQVIWEQHVYVESSADKRVKCASIKDVVVLNGSQNAQSAVKVFALNGETGSLLWSFDNPGILASSDSDLFIANGTTVYSVDPESGNIKWEKQLSASRNITGMMYYDGFLYINTTGIYPYYILNTDGQIASKYTDVSGFHTSQIDIPFYPDMPFGVYIDDATYIFT